MMPEYVITLETIYEDIYEIEADSEEEALLLAENGDITPDFRERITRPTLLGIEEIKNYDDESDRTPTLAFGQQADLTMDESDWTQSFNI